MSGSKNVTQDNPFSARQLLNPSKGKVEFSNFDLVRREIQYAFENVGFFRKHMDNCCLTPADIRVPHDMLRLRPTVKADYRGNFPAGVIATGYTLRSPHVMQFRSSGTGGDRLTSVVHSYNLAQRQATCLEVNPRFEYLWKPGLRLRTCRYAAPNCSDVECANGHSSMNDRLLPDGTLVLPVYHDLFTTPPELVQKALDEIIEYEPHLLFVDPTHLAFLVRELKKLGQELLMRKNTLIISGYTLCTRVARQQIEDYFGSDVYFADMLGMSELGYLGFECIAGKMHINTRDYYVEFICDDRFAEAGELSELVITTLGDKLSPHIRYATGDLYRYSDERCTCGSTLPVVLFEGRAKNMLRLHDDSLLTPRELDDMVGVAQWIDAYRMEQINDDNFSFRFLRNNSVQDQLEADLAARLVDALKTANLSFSESNYLQSDRGGKFLSCISSTNNQWTQRL